MTSYVPVDMKRLLLLLALPLLAACGSTPRTIVDPADDPSSPALPPDQVVVRIYDGPGFTSALFAARTFADLTVMGDGRVFTQGIVPEIFPGPAVVPVLTGRLSSAQLAQVITDIRDADLLRQVDYGEPRVSDAGTVDVTVDVDGHRWTHSAYALQSSTTEQSAERRALSTFIDEVHHLAAPVATEDYPPTALVARAWEATPDARQTPAPTVQDWPGSTPLASEGCQVVTDAAAVRALIGGNELSFYRQGGTTYQVGLHPLLPGDPGCAIG